MGRLERALEPERERRARGTRSGARCCGRGEGGEQDRDGGADASGHDDPLFGRFRGASTGTG